MTCNLYKQREQQIKGLIKKSKLSQLEISTHYFQEPLFVFAKLSKIWNSGFLSKAFLWWSNSFVVDVRLILIYMQHNLKWYSAVYPSRMLSTPGMELCFCHAAESKWAPFTNVWQLSLAAMLFELQLTSEHLRDILLLLLVRPTRKVNTSIYRQLASIHHPNIRSPDPSSPYPIKKI